MTQASRWITAAVLGVVGLTACSRAGGDTLDESTVVRERKIALTEAPEAAQTAILKAQKEQGAKITEIMEKTTKDGARFYEAEFAMPGGGERDYLVTAEGRPAGVANEISEASDGDPWQKSFGLEKRKLSSKGRNAFMILEPGYQLTLQGKEGEDQVTLVITVLNETRRIGDVETRVVEERESANGELIEVSRNYFAFCEETKSIFYFGEDVDMYKGGKVTGHEGSWIADGKRMPGMAMPGDPLRGAKYYQEVAPGEAMDRAEIMGLEEVKTPSGDFDRCLVVEETTPLEPGSKEYKRYAPGIGLVCDDHLLLTKHGFVK